MGKCAVFDTALDVASLTATLGNNIKKVSLKYRVIAKAEAFHAA